MNDGEEEEREEVEREGGNLNGKEPSPGIRAEKLRPAARQRGEKEQEWRNVRAFTSHTHSTQERRLQKAEELPVIIIAFPI